MGLTKNGMRGFAAGILGTCAVFALFYFFIFNDDGQKDKTQKKVEQEPLTEDAVNLYLEENNRVSLSADDYQKYQEWQESNAANKKDEDNKEENSKEEEKQDSKSEPEKSEATTYELTISSGMTPGDISSNLVEAKVLKSDQKDDFDRYLHDNKLEKYVQLGKFKLSSDMSIEEMAKVITKNRS